MEKSKISLHLRELRKKRGLSQVVCAGLLGKHVNVYALWENGEREPKFSDAIEIAKFFGVSLDYLAGLTDDPASKRTTQKD